MDIFMVILGVLDVYVISLWLASGIASLFGASQASVRLYKAAFLPIKLTIDMIIAGVTWPKRQYDRRRFAKEYGFSPWEFAFYPGEGDIISARLNGAATCLQQAFDQEERLQHSKTAVSKAAMAEAKATIEEFKKKFWSLHKLASHVAGYHRRSRCSYRDHLTNR